MRRRHLVLGAGLVLGLLAVGGVVWIQARAFDDPLPPTARRPAEAVASDAAGRDHPAGARFRAAGDGADSSTGDDATLPVPTLRGHPDSERLATARGALGGTLEAGYGKRVVGLVYEGRTGRPLPGVRVTFRGVGGTSRTHTDERGLYETRVPSHLYWYEELRFSKDGYLSNSIRGCARRARSGGRLAPQWLSPVRTEIPGLARDYRGRPAAGVFVRVVGQERVWVSDAAGRFGPVPVPDGRSQLEWVAWGPRCARVEDYWTLEPRLPSVLVTRLVPHAFVPGLVVDEEGRPVANAEVRAGRYPDELSIRTAHDGSFAWPLRVDGGARLVAVSNTRDGMAWCKPDLPARIVIRRHESGSWRDRCGPTYAPRPPPVPEVEARPTVRVEILVVDHQGRPLPWADVGAHRGKGGYSQREWTDARGRCELKAPSGLELTLRVSHFRGASVSRQVTFPVGGPRELRVALSPYVPRRSEPYVEPTEPHATWIEGTVLDAKGRPFPGVWIKAPPWGDDSTDEFGRFRIEGGRPGDRVSLRVSGSDFAPFSAHAVCGAADNEIRLPARSAVRITLKGTPEEDARPEVRVWATSWLTEEILPRHGSAYVLDDGRGYRVSCPVGTYTVAFRLDPGAWALYPDVVVEEGVETERVYAFPRFGRLRGRVRTVDGEPIDEAWVHIARTGEYLECTEADGRFEVDFSPRPTIPAGTFRLFVYAEGFAPTWTNPVDLRSDAVVDVRLRPGVHVTGVLVDATGRGVEAVVGWLTDGGPPLFDWGTDEDGAFEFEGRLPTGTARLAVRVEGRAPHIETVTIPAGRKAVHLKIRVP